MRQKQGAKLVHELGITQEIVAIVSERAGKVRRVVLEIGRLTAVQPDAGVSALTSAIKARPLKGGWLAGGVRLVARAGEGLP